MSLRLHCLDGEYYTRLSVTETKRVLESHDVLLTALKDARYALYGDGHGNPKIDAAIALAEGKS